MKDKHKGRWATLPVACFGLLAAMAAASATIAAGDFDVELATKAWIDTLPADLQARSNAYFEGGYWLLLWNFLYGLAVAWLLLGTRFGLRMKGWAEHITKRAFPRDVLTVAQYLAATFLLGLPLTIYQGFLREHQYGLANQSFGPWFTEQLIGLAVAMVMVSLALGVVYWVIRKAGKRWWMWGSGVTAVFFTFALTINPVFISPLFNDYTPLEEGPVKQEILAMARANGIPADNVYVVDTSRQSTRISANVQGLFGTMRISLNDNLLNGTSLPEIKAVMGHEMGHYALNHGAEFIIYFTLLATGGLLFIHWAYPRVRNRWGGKWGLSDLSDVGGLPLVMALLSVYFLVMTPVSNSITRSGEAEADIFGLNAAGEPDGFASIAMKLAEYRKISPDPLEELVFYDHPSGYNRVAMAMRWKAENPGRGTDIDPATVVPAPSEK